MAGDLEREEQDKVDRLFLKQSPDGLPGLKEAVNATLELRRVLTSFRLRCMLGPEDGELYRLIESWYVTNYVPSDFSVLDYPKSLEERNPYAKFKADHPKAMREWSSELDFLLNEIPPRKLAYRKDLRLKPEEAEQLTAELSKKGPLTRLIRVSPYLTHEENIVNTVVDARLWLNNSELPVDILSGTVSYKDVRMGVPLTRDNDTPPSTFELNLKDRTVDRYWSMQINPPGFMYQPKVTDFPEESRNCYFARMARVRDTHIYNQQMSEAQHAVYLSKYPAADDYEECVVTQLDDWKWSETRCMYKRLAKLIFDVDVEV